MEHLGAASQNLHSHRNQTADQLVVAAARDGPTISLVLCGLLIGESACSYDHWKEWMMARFGGCTIPDDARDGTGTYVGYDSIAGELVSSSKSS